MRTDTRKPTASPAAATALPAAAKTHSNAPIPWLRKALSSHHQPRKTLILPPMHSITAARTTNSILDYHERKPHTGAVQQSVGADLAGGKGDP